MFTSKTSVDVVFVEDIKKAILQLANERGSAKSFYASEVARLVDAKNWKNMIDQVRFVASVLIREGKIVALKSGKPVDFSTSKGLIKFRKS